MDMYTRLLAPAQLSSLIIECYQEYLSEVCTEWLLRTHVAQRTCLVPMSIF